jgi:hypothetical protein
MKPPEAPRLPGPRERRAVGYGGPLSLDAEDLRMLRSIFAEARKQHGTRSDVMRARGLMR